MPFLPRAIPKQTAGPGIRTPGLSDERQRQAALAAAAAIEARRRKAEQRRLERNKGRLKEETTELVAEPQNWWERTKGWIQDQVEHIIRNPLPWLGLSYQAGTSSFSLGDYGFDEFVSYQPLASNLLEHVTYQRVALQADTNIRVTSNPSAPLNINFANGRITLRGWTDANGQRVDWFVQPGSLSFGSITSKQLQRDMVPGPWQTGRGVSVTTIDIDLFGKNWCSFKISQVQGRTLSTTLSVDQADIQYSQTDTLGGNIKVHRYPRVVAVIGGVALAYKVGAGLVALAAPALERLSELLRNPAWKAVP